MYELNFGGDESVATSTTLESNEVDVGDPQIISSPRPKNRTEFILSLPKSQLDKIVNPIERGLLSSPEGSTRHPTKHENFNLWGYTSENGTFHNSMAIEAYYPLNGTLNRLANTTLPVGIQSLSANVLNDSVLIAGGVMFLDNGQWGVFADLLIFDLDTQKLTHGPPMEICISDACTATLNGHYYMCGGSTIGNWASKTCLVYDHASGWSHISDMNSERTSFSLVAIHGRLYALGGYNGQKIVKFMEWYDATRNQWHIIESGSRTFIASATTYNGTIVSCGGYENLDKTTPLNICTQFDPETNVWNEFASMSKARIGHLLINYNGLLMAFSGGLGFGIPDTSVEYYDSLTDKWMPTLNFTIPRWAAAIAAVPQQ